MGAVLSTGDATLVPDDEQMRAHKIVNKTTKDKKDKTLENIVEETADVTMVADDGQHNEAHKEDPFSKPVRNPTSVEKRNMLSKSVEIMIITSLENHVYKFGNEIRRQKEGWPIGLALTGEIAECYMINWDKLFLKKLKSLGIGS